MCLRVLVLTLFPRRTLPPGPLVSGRKHPLTEGVSFLGCPRLLRMHSTPAHPQIATIQATGEGMKK